MTMPAHARARARERAREKAGETFLLQLRKTKPFCRELSQNVKIRHFLRENLGMQICVRSNFWQIVVLRA